MASTSTAIGTAGGPGNQIIIKGRLVGSRGILSQNEGSTITLTSTASIKAMSYGIVGTGAQTILNDGIIEGSESGLVGFTSLHLVNNGRIKGTGPFVGSAAVSTSGDNGADLIENNGTIIGRVLLHGGNDTYVGTRGTISDLISLGDGNDKAYGGIGAETIAGGKGDDLIDGGGGDNTATFSGARADYTVKDNGDGSFTVIDGQADRNGTDHLANIKFAKFSDSTVTLARSSAPPPDTPLTLIGTPGRDNLVGAGAGDVLVALAGKDRLVGGGGDDKLRGGLGNDLLTGGTGSDIFVFDTKLGRTNKANRLANLDEVTDFAAKDDTIHLAKSVFTKIAKKGILKKGAFFKGAAAHDGDDRIVYNKKTGALLYDADGAGHKAPTQFATLQKTLKIIDHKDFFVI